MSLANENSSSIASLAGRLNYLDTVDQFKWYGDFKDLICLVKVDFATPFHMRGLFYGLEQSTESRAAT